MNAMNCNFHELLKKELSFSYLKTTTLCILTQVKTQHTMQISTQCGRVIILSFLPHRTI